MHLSASSRFSNLVKKLGPLTEKNDMTTYKTNPYPLSLSLTCRVKVLTLLIGPNSLQRLKSSSSGKWGGSPLIYTFGIFTAAPELKFPLPIKLAELALSTPMLEEPFKIGSDADDENPAFFKTGTAEEVSSVGEPETAIPICP